MHRLVDSNSPAILAILLAFGVTLTAGACGDDSGDGSGDNDAAAGNFDVPTTAEAIFPYLTAEMYTTDFVAEPEVHGATNGSPHGMVRIYINTALDDSLTAGNSTHPAGAAAVKELYSSDGSTLTGWAVMVKVQNDSDGGKGWYWYENFSTSDSKPAVSGTGQTVCTGCHSTNSRDFFKADHPF